MFEITIGILLNSDKYNFLSINMKFTRFVYYQLTIQTVNNI
jgi:hypothetical protein